MSIKIALGPVLYVGESTPETWMFYINLLIEGGNADNPPVEIKGTDKDVSVTELGIAADFTSAGVPDYIAWRWQVEVPRREKERWIGYEIGPKAKTQIEEWPKPRIFKDVAVPAKGDLPRIAYFSCNGVDDPKVLNRVKKQNELWDRIQNIHLSGKPTKAKLAPSGYHLLIGGGDQVYADGLWLDEDSGFHEFGESPRAVNSKDKVTKAKATRFLQAYIQLYAKRWNRVEVAWALARIPGIFTWDDHDIFDGWGSYEEELHTSDVFQKIFGAASLAFQAFQLGAAPELGGLKSPHVKSSGKHFLQLLTFKEAESSLQILQLDSRSERTRDQVLSSTQWKDLLEVFASGYAGNSAKYPHMLVVSSIPVVYMRFDAVLRTLELLPGRQDLEDDLRDHWESTRHRNERSRLLMNLLGFAKTNSCRVTLLSGDVHVGARGRITSSLREHVIDGEAESTIEQITSSGIVYPPPSWLEFASVQISGTEEVDHVAEGVTTKIIPVAGRTKFLRDRNYLTIQPDYGNKQGRLWFKYEAENTNIPEEIVINPMR